MFACTGYAATIEIDADARLLHGEVAGTRDVITFQVRTIDALKQAFRDSVDDDLAYCAQRGEQPDRPTGDKSRQK